MSASTKASLITGDSKTGKIGNSSSQANKGYVPAVVNSPIDQISFLQRTVGNREVERLLRSGAIQAKLAIGQSIDESVFQPTATEGLDHPVEQRENDGGPILPTPAVRTGGPMGSLPWSHGTPATGQMCNGSGNPIASSVPLYTRQIGILQRKCACGGVAGLSGECEECRKTKQSHLQTKLKINAPGDMYEREADRIADQVMANPAPYAVSAATPRFERFLRHSNGQMDAAPASVDQALASPGKPLEPTLRQEMEQRFGYDFGDVRIHSGAVAEQSARDVNANAYTVGHNIVFGSGRFGPSSGEGRRLIAHELTHVVQQSQRGSATQTKRRSASSASPGGGALARQVKTSATDALLQRDTVTRYLHPEEIGTFNGSFKLPEGGRFYYEVELRNVPALMLKQKRDKLDIECQFGIRTVLQELLKSDVSLNGLPPLRLSLDAGNVKVLTEGHVETLVRRAARAELKRLVANVGPVNRPLDVLEAIVHIMAGNQVSGDYGPAGENLMHPRYYIDVKKNITKQEYVALLWEWFYITNGTVTDKRGVQSIVQGSMARERIPRAAADTERIIAKVAAKEGAKWVARYRVKVQEFTERAVREEVGEMIEAGVRKEREPRPNIAAMSEEEKVKGAAVKVAVTLEHIGEMFHRAVETKEATIASEYTRRFHEQLREYLRKTFKDKLIVDAPSLHSGEHASKMSLPNAVTWLKGGLDAVSAILTLTDPVARRKLFEARSSYFGKVAQGIEINQLLWKFVSGAIAFGGAGTYGLARILGRADLASHVLEVSTKWIGNVSGALFLVGTVHGIAVLLDPNATPNEKAAAAVEATSGALGVASFASRWTPKLAVAGRWGGPIGISLTLNFWQFSKLANLAARARIGLARLDWVSCFKATKNAAQEAQDWMRKLAVTNVLIAQETDPARLSELRKVAEVYRKELLDGHVKPYLAARLRADKTKGDPDDCGPALANRFKPMAGILDRNVDNDEAALNAGAMFLNLCYTAFKEWDAIVASSIK